MGRQGFSCYWDANRVDDRLANLGIDREIGLVFFDSPVREVMDILNADAIGVNWPRISK